MEPIRALRPKPPLNNPGAVPAPDPSLPFLCADKGKEAKENRPTEQRLVSNALCSLPPRPLRKPVFGVATDSAILPQRRYGHPGLRLFA